MLARLIQFYRRFPIQESVLSPIWKQIFSGQQQTLHRALLNGDEAALTRGLNEVFKTSWVSGFTGRGGFLPPSDLRRLAEAVGIIPIPNPEQDSGKAGPELVNSWINEIEDLTGITYGTFGLPSDRLHFYIAILIAILRHFSGHLPQPLVEIGPGIGYLPAMLAKSGKQCHIIDLPTQCVIQAFTLSQVLGEDAIWLSGEPTSNAKIRILPATCDLESARISPALVVNTDSFPEIPNACQDLYLKMFGQKKGATFYSVNQESPTSGQRRSYEATRATNWKLQSRAAWHMRPGYVEEFYIAT